MCSALNEGLPAVSLPSVRHHTKDKGDLAVGQVIADLLREGVQVCLPISEHLPFDMIAVSSSMRELRRLQVKYVGARCGALRVALRRSHADRHGVHQERIHLEEIDAFAIFCPDTSKVYYVLRDEIPIGQRSYYALRLFPSRNGQAKRTRPAEDFVGVARIFGPVAQRIEQRVSNP